MGSTTVRFIQKMLRDQMCLLTFPEAEVLSLLADGLKNCHIGERLFISPQTVRRHICGACTVSLERMITYLQLYPGIPLPGARRCAEHATVGASDGYGLKPVRGSYQRRCFLADGASATEKGSTGWPNN
jgi:Bacterial regulatory proteins, luxR family